MDTFVVFVIWAVMCGGVALLAVSRGRTALGFFLLSFMASPLIGIIILLLMSNLVAEAIRDEERRKDDERAELARRLDDQKHLESLRAISALQVNSSPPQGVPPFGMRSVADELTKLVELKKNGILSTEEFERQKGQLLSN